MTSLPTLEDLLAMADEPFVDQLYRTLLGREPDPAGRASHLKQLQRGLSKEALIALFAQCPEGLAHGARIEGLNELCAGVRANPGGRLTRWFARITRPAVLVITRRMAATENRLGQQVRALGAPIEQLPALADDVKAMAQGIDEQGQGLQEMAARMAAVDRHFDDLDGRLAQLGQAVTGLTGHFAALEQQGQSLAQRLAESEERQRVELQQMQQRLLDAVERLELRLALSAPAGVATPASEPAALTTGGALDMRALQRVRRMLGGAESAR